MHARKKSGMGWWLWPHNFFLKFIYACQCCILGLLVGHCISRVMTEEDVKADIQLFTVKSKELIWLKNRKLTPNFFLLMFCAKWLNAENIYAAEFGCQYQRQFVPLYLMEFSLCACLLKICFLLSLLLVGNILNISKRSACSASQSLLSNSEYNWDANVAFCKRWNWLQVGTEFFKMTFFKL